MRTFAGAAAHHSCRAKANNRSIEICQITEVLKGLGIAFTDNIGIRIAVKDIDELPGIRLIILRILGMVFRIFVIGDLSAYKVLIAEKFFVVGFPGEFSNDRLCPFSSNRRCSCFLSIYLIFVYICRPVILRGA